MRFIFFINVEIKYPVVKDWHNHLFNQFMVFSGRMCVLAFSISLAVEGKIT